MIAKINWKGASYWRRLLLHMCIHTFILTYLITYLLTYLHTYILTCIHAYMHTYIQPNLNTYLQVQIGLTITSFIFGALQVQEKLNGDCFILWISSSSAIVTKWKNSRPYTAIVTKPAPKKTAKEIKKTSKENSQLQRKQFLQNFLCLDFFYMCMNYIYLFDLFSWQSVL